MKLVGIIGSIGCGKSTAGDVLAENGYTKVSFASILKDATSVLFSWDREMLEGATKESREQREKPDEYWSKRLDRNITPRIVLQEMGTEVIRNSFHQDFWIIALEKALLSGKKGDGPFVITDCRFQNEMNFVRYNGGDLIRIKRGPDPEWFSDAIKFNAAIAHSDLYSDITESINLDTLPHPSEWKWVREESYYDYVVENNSTLEDFKEKIIKIDQLIRK